MAMDHLKLQIHTSNAPENNNASSKSRYARRTRRMRIKTQLSFHERLLRNSCLACAVLLGILALGNLQQPWAKKAAEGIEQALTMKVDLDQSLGQLSFVQKLMPESALVFFNLSGDHEYALPVDAQVNHRFTSAQPWLMFECASAAPVRAIAPGTISAVSPLSDGGYGVLIDHGNGLESICANLQEVALNPGDEVIRGGTIGTSAGNIYFELRQGGEPIDPSEKMGL